MSGPEELRALVWALKCADEWMSCVEGHLRDSYTFKRDREAIRALLATPVTGEADVELRAEKGGR